MQKEKNQNCNVFPTSRPQRSASPAVISNTAQAFGHMLNPSQGRKFFTTFTILYSLSRYTTSIANRIKHICTLLQGARNSPVAAGNFLRNIKPANRVKKESASNTSKKGAPAGAPFINIICFFIISFHQHAHAAHNRKNRRHQYYYK